MQKIDRLWQRINALIPNPQMTLKNNNYSSIQWFDEREQPTKEAVEAVDVSALVTNEAVLQNRRNEYGDIPDQLDMIYWDKINNTDEWVDHITSIKNKYPKK